MKKRNGFTLVEVLIVVVILGILAAIVIPQFSDASEEAKLSTLVSDLQTVRSQVQLYKLQHKAKLPGAGTATFGDAMTKYTDADGKLTAVQAPADEVYGPYLQKMPKNPFNDSNEVSIGEQVRPATTAAVGILIVRPVRLMQTITLLTLLCKKRRSSGCKTGEKI
jgi:general secretion pathway protein G